MLNGVKTAMQHGKRKTGRAHNPQTELAERWPGWRFAAVPLGGFEAILADSKLILIDVDGDDIEWQRAHSLAHLDLHMDTVLSGRCFTAEEERQATWLADIRLDRVWARDWQIGESA